jgi:hypothetical protein
VHQIIVTLTTFNLFALIPNLVSFIGVLTLEIATWVDNMVRKVIIYNKLEPHKLATKLHINFRKLTHEPIFLTLLPIIFEDIGFSFKQEIINYGAQSFTVNNLGY